MYSVKHRIIWHNNADFGQGPIMVMLWRIRCQTPCMDLIKQGQVILIMYHPLELRALLPVNQCYQWQMTCSGRFQLCMVQTHRGSISLTMVAQPRQMDSHNPPTGGECGLLEYDTVDVKYFSCSAIAFPAHSSPRTVILDIFHFFWSSLSHLGATAFTVG